MSGVNIPFLPTGLWLFAASLSLILVLFAFVHYLYYRRRIQAVVQESGSAAALAAKRDMLQADVNALTAWIATQKDELSQLKAEREEQERVRSELAQLSQQSAVQDQKNESLRREVGELENQRYLTTQTLENLRREVGDLEAKRGDAAALEEKLRRMRTQLEEAQKAMENIAGIESKIIAFKAQQVSLEQKITELNTAVEQAGQAAETKRQEVDKVSSVLDSLKSQAALLQQKKDDHLVSLQGMAAKKEALEGHIGEIQATVDKAKKAKDAAVEILDHVKAAREERRREQNMVEELTARKIILESQIKDYFGRLGDGKTGSENELYTPYADLLEVPAQCMTKEHFSSGKHVESDEWIMLQNLRKKLQEDDLKFSPRIIDAFHTSLKCHDINPLTVLAGVSGTGKTLLPTYYSGIMGMHILVMAVQPRWDSPQDMFGFYNYIEKQYKATELARALILMDPYNHQRSAFKNLDGKWTRDRMLMVLLDEMNLARTEYYFSEFLSKLELRRLVKTEALSNDRERAEIELDAGPSRGLKFRFWVASNVLFVGTMNEDETTQALSDKVLDRANVLRFGKPDELTKPSRLGVRNSVWSNSYLSFETWRSWYQDYDEGDPWFDDIGKWSASLNEALNRVGRPFGYRVQQAMATYVANYPLVDQDNRHTLAFADQIEQKIIPKLRGVEIGDQNATDCLNELEDIIDKLGDGKLAKAFSDARAESEQVGLFQWRGVTRPVED